MNLFSNLDLLSVGIIIASIGMLGFVVFFNNSKSITSKSFLAFCLLTISWGSLNYLTYQVTNPEIGLWLLRLSIFTAVWHSLFLFQLLYVFPKDTLVFPKIYTNVLLPVVTIISLLNLSPFTFKKIAEISSSGQITKIENGIGIIFFSTLVFSLVISSIFIFIKKLKTGDREQKKQIKPMLIGIISTFTLILLFNFIFPAFLSNSKFIIFGAFFVFPFITGTAYSIFKHRLLNIKVISTEILVFSLAIVILLDVVTSQDILSLSFRLFIFMLVIGVGITLVKSVIREVKQREQLEILDKELGEANEKLKSLDLARAEFISIASHQLRTPPATVKWYLSSIIDGDYGKLTKKVTDQLKKTQTTNNHLISLIEDMLNVSRIERGKMEFLFAPTNVEELAKFAYEQLIPMAGDKNLELIYEAPKTTLPEIMADKEKLRQVMNNLIDNAIKYTKTGKVTVLLKKSGADILFKVTDSGKGINETDKAAIFQKYTRGKESIKQSAGLGLGLYVAKIIIDQHKGKIWAESEGEGKGSSFCFTIPINNGLKETTLVDLSKNQVSNK